MEPDGYLRKRPDLFEAFYRASTLEQRYPTAWAYEQACAALEKSKQRERELIEAGDALERWIDLEADESDSSARGTINTWQRIAHGGRISHDDFDAGTTSSRDDSARA